MQTVVQKSEVRIIAGLGTTGINGYDSVQSYIVVDHLYQIYLPSLMEVWEYYRVSAPFFKLVFLNLFIISFITIELYLYILVYLL